MNNINSKYLNFTNFNSLNNNINTFKINIVSLKSILILNIKFNKFIFIIIKSLTF